MLLGSVVKSDYKLGFPFYQRKDDAFRAVNSSFLPLWLINHDIEVAQQAARMFIDKEEIKKRRKIKKEKIKG